MVLKSYMGKMEYRRTAFTGGKKDQKEKRKDQRKIPIFQKTIKTEVYPMEHKSITSYAQACQRKNKV